MIFLVIVSISILIAQHLEQEQLYRKLRGTINKTVAKGYNDAMKVMVLNRVFIVMYFSSVGFLIDTGVSGHHLALTFAFSYFCLTLANIVTYKLRFKKLKGLFVNFESKIFLVAVYFNLMGLTIPFLISSHFPEYRLTLSNLSFIFNSIFTVLMVFVIEKKVSLAFDTSIRESFRLVKNLVFIRTFSNLSAAITMLILRMILK
jgi:hypothetical protein